MCNEYCKLYWMTSSERVEVDFTAFSVMYGAATKRFNRGACGYIGNRAEMSFSLSE